MAAALAVLASLLSAASSLKNLFTSVPSLADIVALIVTEVETVFVVELASEDIRHAADKLKAARDFLATDYVNAQDKGATKAELWTLLNSADAVSLNDLRACANDMESWASDASKTDGAKSIVQQAVSTYVGVYTLLCIMYREFAAVAPDEPTSAGFQQDMKDYASKAVTTVTPLLEKTLSEHQNAVSDPFQGFFPHHFGDSFWVIKDSWFSDDENIAGTLDHGGGLLPDKAAQAIMVEAQSLYRKMLAVSSSADEHKTLVAQFEAIPMPDEVLTAFQQTYLPRANAFSDWYANNKSALASLQKLSTS